MKWMSFVIGLSLSALSFAQKGSVIFVHPDGTGLGQWDALRLLKVGPDGMLNWDRMSRLAQYRGSMTDALAATSNGGGTAHAYGTRPSTGAFGRDGKVELLSASGKPYSVMVEAKRAGLGIGIVSSATVADAGTGTFLARVQSRREYAEIVRQMLSHQPDVLLGGGESYFLPKGVRGRHGEGIRTDGRNLLNEARKMGYTVVFDAKELASAATSAKRLLGVFAEEDTFNDQNEEALRAKGLPIFKPGAPRFDSMVQAALKVLERSGRRFFLMAEEEGTDNFAGENNASAVLECLAGADRALGHAMEFQKRHQNTMILCGSDSNCGGMNVVGETNADMPLNQPLSARDPENGAPWDGRGGTGTLPFLAAPDRFGTRLPFAISWAGQGDMAAGVVARAHGLNSQLMGTSVLNTDMYRLTYRTLFGRWPESR